uniref:Uncharacterized protein n=1 Tax=Glossina palpalis gambiensis TaxID=67801 RepID=A0A1B0B0I7_9MUSC
MTLTMQAENRDGRVVIICLLKLAPRALNVNASGKVPVPHIQYNDNNILFYACHDIMRSLVRLFINVPLLLLLSFNGIWLVPHQCYCCDSKDNALYVIPWFHASFAMRGSYKYCSSTLVLKTQTLKHGQYKPNPYNMNHWHNSYE